ncbi:hypothetical protein [Vitiosangium sp. GDMCC 1.1324]|uniref:hypothetical protein n=1 Tax=Vitiosangium sp. (strain GDMCC 1.1324) TaxID=2138576 RepID=UPI000D36A24F|nr:hypothetical protein [Vitiosangium sp. GDMCC 1.1324]PTL77592.1 hypothetical protein DAT35_43115 [Vitiosangium sp. GDMCC 1.1324]
MSSSGIVVGPQLRRASLAVAALGLLGLGSGLVLAPTRGFSSLLTNGFFFLTLALGGAVFLALNAVANAGWYTVFKRIPEAFASYVPVGSVFLLLVLAGLPSLYLWARPGVMEADHLLHQKAAFLNAPGFAIRMALMLGLWIFFTWRLRKNSLAQDAETSAEPTRRNVATSALFLVLFALSFCLASFDWLMSLEPHWFSTIYGLYNIAGMLESSVAAITVAVIVMQRSGRMKELNTSHLHDLGKLMFGFATLWAYLWFSQFLLIWYANIPEETVYFIHRMHHGWRAPFFINVVLNWALPFVLLLPKPAKRNPSYLCFVAGIMLTGRWLDLHLMIAPANMPEYTGIGVWDVAGLLGLGALFVLTVTRTMDSVPLIPRHDPYLVESLHHHT